MRILAALAPLALLAACTITSDVHEFDMTLAADDRVEVADVEFAYGEWVQQDPDFLAAARQSAAAWSARIRAGFDAGAETSGMRRRTGSVVPLTITVLDLDTGNRAGRAFLGVSSSDARIYVQATAAGKGGLTAGAETGDDRSFDDVLFALGETIAERLARGR